MNSFQKMAATTCVAVTLLAGGVLPATAAPSASPTETAAEGAVAPASFTQKLVMTGGGEYYALTASGFERFSTQAAAEAAAVTATFPERGTAGKIQSGDRYIGSGVRLGNESDTHFFEAHRDDKRVYPVSVTPTGEIMYGRQTLSHWGDLPGNEGEALLFLTSTHTSVKLVDLTAPAPAPAISVPEARPGETVQATISFPRRMYGKLVFVAPAHTTIVGLTPKGCKITDGGKKATCGVDGDYWQADHQITLKVDSAVRPDSSISWGSTLPGGTMTMVKSGSADITTTLTAKVVRGGWAVSKPTMRPGTIGTSTVAFDGTHTGPMTVTAPTDTTLTGIAGGTEKWTISADGTTATAPSSTWTGARTLSLLASTTAEAGEKIGGSVTSGTGLNSITVPLNANVPEAKSTVLGTYALEAKPMTGTHFSPGDDGTVSFTSRPSRGPDGIDITPGESMSWTTTLPKGLEIRGNTCSDVYTGYTATCDFGATAPDGTRTVVYTVTRDADQPAVTDAFQHVHTTTYDVRATADLAPDAEVVTTFTPTAGHTSDSPRAETTVPVTQGPVVTVTNPADPADGYTPGTAFTFTGKATPGKTITVQNVYGTVVAQNVPVAADGTWSWTRANMGTSNWMLEFVQDKGTANEHKATVYNFKPNATPAPVVTVTNPANPADGYTPGTAFTFTGKAT
ncbi:hypothetical protein, partial [uncultured Frigoribacterium sp.]|uniref:hypothetical protein n=1 Tax=uncultured Frigoribacterium sp. TaxID=335377 RepID=UPI0028D419FE